LEERGLLAVDLNNIIHNERQAPDPLGVNPLQFMGVYKHTDENWYLVESKVIETSNGPDFNWDCFDEYKKPVKRPVYVPDVAQTVMPLARYTDRFDFMTQSGSTNMGQWLDTAAKKAGR
jgi:hypothetical protein